MAKTTPSSEHIRNMFDRLASRYDIFNHLTSLGMAVAWRKEVLRPLEDGMRVLDLGCGTGDLAIMAAQKIRGSGEVVGLDFSPQMLAFAEERVKKLGLNGLGSLRFVLKKAEELPLENDKPYDWVVSGFVLRNLYEHIDRVLSGTYQSLKKGGGISFLDITEPPNPAALWFWRIYMNTLVGLYGKILFGKNYPVFYLTESAHRFFKASDFVKKLAAAGFKNVQARSFMLGTVTLYQAVKE